MAELVILGAGMMGTAFAWPLVDRGHAVRLVGTHLDEEIIRSIAQSRRHPKLGLTVPEGVTPFSVNRLNEALEGADGIVLGVSSAGVRWAARALQPFAVTELPISMISKGLEWTERELQVLPDVFAEELTGSRTGVAPVAVAGPCIAGELARRVPTSVVLTGRRREACERWAEWVRGPYYYVWTTEDVIGAEVCAALKNAYAMGIALAAGIHQSRGGEPGSIALHNYEASVFAQSVWEMRKLIRLLGGDPEQAVWLPGVGDLDVTCNGGRTGKFGQLLGTGIGLQQAIARMEGATLECLEILRTLRSALNHYEAAGRVGEDDFPLAKHLAAIALDGADVAMPFARFFSGAGKPAVSS